MKTILCDIVEDWAALLVYRDSLVKCSHFIKYGPMKLKVKRSHGAINACEGPEKCEFCHSYKEDVFRSLETSFPSAPSLPTPRL